MKNRIIIIISLIVGIAILMGIWFFVGKTSEDNIYKNKELGIQFKIFTTYGDKKIEVENNKIGLNLMAEEDTDQYLLVFDKKDDQSIEEAILDMIKSTGKDPKKCTVGNVGPFWGNQDYQQYGIGLANPISYTEDELIKIKAADKFQKEDPFNAGPIDGDFVKDEIGNERFIEACSISKNPPGPGTSSRSTDTIIFNKKSKIVFFPGSADPSFYDKESIYFLE